MSCVNCEPKSRMSTSSRAPAMQSELPSVRSASRLTPWRRHPRRASPGGARVRYARAVVPDLHIQVARIGPVDVPLPRYQTPGSAGMDLHAALVEPLTVGPLGRARVPTGLIFAIPASFEGQVRPRSGLAWRTGLTVLNAPGTVDSDYRGEVQVLLVNLSDTPVVLAPLERIA